MDNKNVSSLHPEWLNPAEHVPPAGSPINLITKGGVSVEGNWSNDGRYLAWSPKLKTPAWLKAKISESYLAR